MSINKDFSNSLKNLLKKNSLKVQATPIRIKILNNKKQKKSNVEEIDDSPKRILSKMKFKDLLCSIKKKTANEENKSINCKFNNNKTKSTILSEKNLLWKKTNKKILSSLIGFNSSAETGYLFDTSKDLNILYNYRNNINYLKEKYKEKNNCSKINSKTSTSINNYEIKSIIRYLCKNKKNYKELKEELIKEEYNKNRVPSQSNQGRIMLGNKIYENKKGFPSILHDNIIKKNYSTININSKKEKKINKIYLEDVSNLIKYKDRNNSKTFEAINIQQKTFSDFKTLMKNQLINLKIKTIKRPNNIFPVCELTSYNLNNAFDNEQIVELKFENNSFNKRNKNHTNSLKELNYYNINEINKKSLIDKNTGGKKNTNFYTLDRFSERYKNKKIKIKNCYYKNYCYYKDN